MRPKWRWGFWKWETLTVCENNMISPAASGENKHEYLSKRPRHPQGGHSCGWTSPDASTGPGWPRRPGTARHPGRCPPHPPQSGCSPGLQCPPRSPAAGTPRGRRWCPRGRHTLFPTCHCGIFQLALHSGSSRPSAWWPANLRETQGYYWNVSSSLASNV